MSQSRVLLIGGGTAGISVTARLRAAGQADITVSEPSDTHDYQPLWTLVGGGRAPLKESRRDRRALPTGSSAARGPTRPTPPATSRSTRTRCSTPATGTCSRSATPAAAPTARPRRLREQAPVVAKNLTSVMTGGTPTASYDGYASCPLTTARDKMLLAEFDYTMKPHPSFPPRLLDAQKERKDMWYIKRYGLPFMYRNLMPKGRA